ncbi:hypothetical protein [Leptospira noguchii]|uniref:hypothetical protein n=1 Tax=Leptospira noguchii TaxID=28182 RepID=UPI00037BB438|nr:hypothetical protein [Leptospira noguchii]
MEPKKEKMDGFKLESNKKVINTQAVAYMLTRFAKIKSSACSTTVTNVLIELEKVAEAGLSAFSKKFIQSYKLVCVFFGFVCFVLRVSKDLVKIGNRLIQIDNYIFALSYEIIFIK